MKKIFAAFFALLGIGFAAAAVGLSFASRDAAPVLVRRSEETAACASGMLDAVCRGDFASAGAYMYGSPTISSGGEVDSETGKMIWDAFVESLSYEILGDCRACDRGVALDVRIHCLNFDSATRRLKERSRTLLEERVASAGDVDEIYDGSANYREDFVMAVLKDATEAALKEDASYTDREITLTLVFDRGQWWVVPDAELLSAISGGIA